MIITRTPFRISFFGGGTDYPVFYKEHGGAVLSTTINKYCYITCRYLPPFFDHKFRIRYTKKEDTRTIDEIVHPSVRECLRYMEIDKGVEIVHTGDLPAMSGIGSSSSFTVGLLNALYALKGEVVTKRRLAFDAIHVEQNIIGESVGSQDQTASAFGGFNRIEFGGRKDGIFVQTIPLNGEKLEYLQSCLLFYFSGYSRYASEVSKEQIERTPQKVKELNLMKEMVDEAINILNGPVEKFDAFGKLLHESWMVKRQLTKLISNGSIDDIYQAAINSGAIGGKLCGAGGGGFILLFVPPENQDKVKDKLKDLLLVPIRFENLGSHLVFYST
ncbi:MAG: kinase [Acetobacterium woodii]|nr:kinase [Acetobacterium woodii]MBI5677811.1 kinase [Planctomycetota bacterium]